MLKQLIHEKINEVFLEMQNAEGITDGGIDPFDALQLEQIEESLAELVEKVIDYQKGDGLAMKIGQLIAVNGNIYEYGGIEKDGLHKVYVVDIDEEGKLTAIGSTWYFTDEEIKNSNIHLTQDQWYGVVKHFLEQNHCLTEEEIDEATEDIVGRCFVYGRPKFNELEGYVECYLNR